MFQEFNPQNQRSLTFEPKIRYIRASLLDISTLLTAVKTVTNLRRSRYIHTYNRSIKQIKII